MSLQPSVATTHASDHNDFFISFFNVYSVKQINYVKYLIFNFSQKNNNYYTPRHILRYIVFINIGPLIIEKCNKLCSAYNK